MLLVLHYSVSSHFLFLICYELIFHSRTVRLMLMLDTLQILVDYLVDWLCGSNSLHRPKTLVDYIDVNGLYYP